MKYFAYGSNMSFARLQQRCPSARFVGAFTLKGHQLKFHKNGQDTSAKCDAFETNNEFDLVYGALFDLDDTDKETLDRIEGLGRGYNQKTVSVENETLGKVDAITYYAIDINENLLPFSWYLNHVIIGAKQSELPSDYLALIEIIESVEDPDRTRDAMQREMYR